MFRVIGIAVVAAVLAGGVLYFNGYWDGDAKVEMTSKGKQALNDGLDAVQSGVTKGIDHLKADTGAKE